MKKFTLVLAVLFAIVFTSCTPEAIQENETQQIDPKKDCPPNDRDCNGIPDDQE